MTISVSLVLVTYEDECNKNKTTTTNTTTIGMQINCTELSIKPIAKKVFSAPTFYIQKKKMLSEESYRPFELSANL